MFPKVGMSPPNCCGSSLLFCVECVRMQHGSKSRVITMLCWSNAQTGASSLVNVDPRMLSNGHYAYGNLVLEGGGQERTGSVTRE